MAGKKKSKTKPPVFRQMRSSYFKPQIGEDGTVRTAYKYGSRTVYLSAAEAGRIEEELKVYYENKKVIDKGKFSRGKKAEMRKINEVKRTRTTRRVIDIKTGKYNQATAAFLARMPDIVDGMKAYLKDNTALNAHIKVQLDLLISKIQRMTPEERARFYEENPDLFSDMTDYYEWLKKNSGNIIRDSSKPSAKYKDMTIDSYVKKNVMNVKDINKKIHEFSKKNKIDFSKRTFNDIDDLNE